MARQRSSTTPKKWKSSVFAPSPVCSLLLPDGSIRLYVFDKPGAMKVHDVMRDYPGHEVNSLSSSRTCLDPAKTLHGGSVYYLTAVSPASAFKQAQKDEDFLPSWTDTDCVPRKSLDADQDYLPESPFLARSSTFTSRRCRDPAQHITHAASGQPSRTHSLLARKWEDSRVCQSSQPAPSGSLLSFSSTKFTPEPTQRSRCLLACVDPTCTSTTSFDRTAGSLTAVCAEGSKFKSLRLEVPSASATEGEPGSSPAYGTDSSSSDTQSPASTLSFSSSSTPSSTTNGASSSCRQSRIPDGLLMPALWEDALHVPQERA